MECLEFSKLEETCNNIFSYIDNVTSTIKYGETKIVFLIGMFKTYLDNNSNILNGNCESNLNIIKTLENKYTRFGDIPELSIDSKLYYKVSSSPWTAILKRFSSYEILVTPDVYKTVILMIKKDLSNYELSYLENTKNKIFSIVKDALKDCTVCDYIKEDETTQDVAFDENRVLTFRELSNKLGPIEVLEKYSFIVDVSIIDEKNVNKILSCKPSPVTGKPILTINKKTGNSGFENKPIIAEQQNAKPSINADDYTYFSSKGGDESNCLCTPGYVFDGIKDDLAICKFDYDKWINSAFYKSLKLSFPNGETPIPIFVWFGTAPFCGYSAEDVWMEGYIPIRTHPWGSGKKCWTGDKWLAMLPMTPEQHSWVAQAKQDILKKKEIDAEVTKSVIKLATQLLEITAKLLI